MSLAGHDKRPALTAGENEPSGHASAQRLTLPALMHEVHTLIRRVVPLMVARTRWMFGFQRRLVFFFDQGTL